MERKGKPYSPAHLSKYKVVAELINDKSSTILEVGSGMGYGIERLLKKKCIGKYLGIEVVGDCVKFLNQKFASHRDKISIIHDDWLNVSEKTVQKYFGKDQVDFSLCIEVIEHNKRDLSVYYNFLSKIANLTKRALF